MGPLDTIVSIASNLTSALSALERHRQLIGAVHEALPCDAAALLRLDEGELVPVVCEGLSEDVMGRRFSLREHPRLEIICRSEEPVLFESDCALPDPFDGLLADELGELQHVHSCLGCPLWVGDELIGALTADAAAVDAFVGIDPSFLAAVGALAAAEMRTTLLIEALEQSAERQGLIARDLMRDLQMREGTEIIGTTTAMQRLRHELELVARSDLTVLVTGETGVGKELVSRAVHAASERRREPMLQVNCAALPENLTDSELFGHVSGAFTGATSDRAGKFEVADAGTLFLDEIGELPLSTQPKLLRALQHGEIQRVGSDKLIKADVRVIAASNRDLEQEVKAGRFRADLYHRLHVYPLHVPPLRERRADIPLLAGYFCDVTRTSLGLGPLRLQPGAVDALKRYLWPGNVRELENVISRAALRGAARVTPGEQIVLTVAHLGQDFGSGGEAPNDVEPCAELGVRLVDMDLKEATREFQRSMIRRVLAEREGNWAAAARRLGMHRSNLHHLAKRLGLK